MQLVLALYVAALVGAAAAKFLPTPELETQWTAFKIQHRKQYETPAEEVKRRLQWESNMIYIEQHNQAYARGEFGFDLAMNHLGDLHESEVKDMLNGYKEGEPNFGAVDRQMFDINALNASDIPANIDWRDAKIVAPVKDQKQCGSCWAFSAIGSLESAHAKKTGELVQLSEQNLVDCSGTQGNHGCRGGWMDWAFEYVKANGIDTEASYAYTAKDGTCKFKKETVGATLASYTDIPNGDEKSLTAAIATAGPVSVAIDASGSVFQFYHSGVFYNSFCSSTRLDHGVLAVGYGTEGGKDFYLIKNSWGERWGQTGYIKMARNRSNNCGIATKSSYPVV